MEQKAIRTLQLSTYQGHTKGKKLASHTLKTRFHQAAQGLLGPSWEPSTKPFELQILTQLNISMAKPTQTNILELHVLKVRTNPESRLQISKKSLVNFSYLGHTITTQKRLERKLGTGRPINTHYISSEDPLSEPLE